MPEVQSPVLPPKQETTPQPNYSETEAKYLGGLQKRLTLSRDTRERAWDEFDGMGLSKYAEENRKGANSYIKPRDNPQETNFVTGTTNQKVDVYVSHLMNLDLAPEVQAFDEDNQLLQSMGQTMEDVIFKTHELDDDDEKKHLRTHSLVEQGTVFVEEVWDICEKKFKDLKTPMRNYTGKVSGVEWTERLKRVYEGPRRNILRIENVYLGDYNVFAMAMQPFAFTVEHMDYEQAKVLYGKWERWDNVPRSMTNVAQSQSTLYNMNWSLTNVPSGKVEVIKYQDPWNDEYMILCNGVMMLPVGFPLPWRWQGFNIEKQVLEVIHANFPYGKSLPSRLRVTQGLIDEMMRLAILKTQKSFLPPRANLTGRVLSSKVFFPSAITANIDPSKLPSLEPNAQGVTSGEASMIQMLFRNMDENSVDPLTAGQSPQGGDPTATQVITLKQQAERMLGLTVFAAAQLERKLAYLRLFNILENWFEPVDDKVDEVRKVLVKKYRSFARPRTIDGQGPGVQYVRVAPRDRTPDEDEVYREEEGLSAQLSMPVRITYLDPQLIHAAKLEWFIVVKPTEKKTSEVAKAVWDQFLERMKNFPNADWEYLGVRTAEKWGENPGKVFRQQQPEQEQQLGPDGQPVTPLPAVPQLRQQASLGRMTKEAA